MNDLISRPALIAALESYKAAAGDMVIRVIVDRIIGIVKAQKTEEETPVERNCDNCKHIDVHFESEPCWSCYDSENWELWGG